MFSIDNFSHHLFSIIMENRVTHHHPFIGGMWVLLAPIIWLMAALSKMDTAERYNLHLAFWSIVSLAALVFGIAAIMRKRWANAPLTLLSASAASFWYWAWTASTDGVNIVIALAFTVMSGYLFLSNFWRQSS